MQEMLEVPTEIVDSFPRGISDTKEIQGLVFREPVLFLEHQS